MPTNDECGALAAAREIEALFFKYFMPQSLAKLADDIADFQSESGRALSWLETEIKRLEECDPDGIYAMEMAKGEMLRAVLRSYIEGVNSLLRPDLGPVLLDGRKRP